MAIENLPDSPDRPKQIQQLLLDKTHVNEAPTITSLRQSFAEQGLQHYINENNAVRVLDMLDIMNENGIQALDASTLRRIVEIVASSDEAINHLVDPEDLTYRMELNDLPAWIRDEISYQKTARYSMRAVQYKFHQVILPALFQKIHQDADLANPILTQLFRIVESPNFQRTRHPNNPDRILDTIASILSQPDDGNFPDLKEKSIGILQRHSQTLASSWKTLAERSPAIFLRMQKLLPELVHIGELSSLDIREIKGAPGTIVSVQTQESIDAEFRRQRDQNEATALNLLVAIGRPIRSRLITDRATLANGQSLRFTENSFGVSISTEGSWIVNQLEVNPAIAKAIASQISLQIENIPPDAQIRIIRGGFPNSLTHALIALLYTDPKITDEIRRRIVFIDYDQGKQAYFETPLIFASK